MESALVMRFDYGSILPWVRHEKREAVAIAGPDVLHLRASVDVRGDNAATCSRFDVVKGQSEKLADSSLWNRQSLSRAQFLQWWEGFYAIVTPK